MCVPTTNSHKECAFYNVWSSLDKCIPNQSQTVIRSFQDEVKRQTSAKSMVIHCKKWHLCQKLHNTGVCNVKSHKDLCNQHPGQEREYLQHPETPAPNLLPRLPSSLLPLPPSFPPALSVTQFYLHSLGSGLSWRSMQEVLE